MKSALFLLALLPLLAPAQRRNHDGRDWRVHDQDAIRRNFSVSAGSGPAKLLVDNISGYVHVTGYSGTEIQVSVQQRIGADSNEALAEAKRDVKLDMSQQGNFVRLYVDGPFRTSNGTNYRGDDYYGYRVSFDYDIQVPAGAELTLKTVNDGDIVVRKTNGDFEVRGVNGGIDMEEVGGSGSVRTVNGSVKVGFSRNPAKPTDFRSVNGRLDVYFQPPLDADLSFHRVNGEVFTDFDVTTRPSNIKGETIDGKFVYRADRRAMEVRAGKGGPELSFDTVNGSIRLHSKGF